MQLHADGVQRLAHLGSLTVAHEAGIHEQADEVLRRQRAGEQGEGHGGVHAAGYEKKDLFRTDVVS